MTCIKYDKTNIFTIILNENVKIISCNVRPKMIEANVERKIRKL